MIINKQMVNDYVKSHPGEYIRLPKNAAAALIKLGIAATPIEGTLLVAIMLDDLATGTAFEVQVSQDEYNKALEEDGPLAAALTNPQGDSCNIL